MYSLWRKIFFFSCIHYDFSKHFNLSSIKSAFTFFNILSYIVTLQSFEGCLTISIVNVQFWKEAQKNPTVSTNWAFILRLLLTVLITELRKFASYPPDTSSCCYAWCIQSPWPLCFWRICPNSASTSKESLKVTRSVACFPAVQQTCIECMNQSRSQLFQEPRRVEHWVKVKKFVLVILQHQYLANPSLCKHSLLRQSWFMLGRGAAVHYSAAWVAQRKPISTDKTKTEMSINS